MRRQRTHGRDVYENVRSLGDGYKVEWRAHPASSEAVAWTLYRYRTFASNGTAGNVAEAIGQAKHAAARHARRQASYASSGSTARDRVPMRDRRHDRRTASRDSGLDKKSLHKAIDADLKAKDKAKLQALRAELVRKEIEDKARCKAARAVSLAHAKRIRERADKAAAAIRKEIARYEQRARTVCVSVPTRRAGAHAPSAERKAYLEEKAYQASLRRAQKKTTSKRPGIRKTIAEASSESDDAVRHNIPSHLVPLWNRVKRGIKAGPRISRTDAFLKYAEEHPEEVYADMDDATDALIADLERQQRAGRDRSRSQRARTLRRA